MTQNITICVGTVGSGAWTSTNGGESWRRVGRGLGNESRIYGLAVHPRESRTVFAGAEDGIYYTNDAGETWRRAVSPQLNSAIRSLVVMNRDWIVAVTRWFLVLMTLIP